MGINCLTVFHVCCKGPRGAGGSGWNMHSCLSLTGWKGEVFFFLLYHGVSCGCTFSNNKCFISELVYMSNIPKSKTGLKKTVPGKQLCNNNPIILWQPWFKHMTTSPEGRNQPFIWKKCALFGNGLSLQATLLINVILHLHYIIVFGRFFFCQSKFKEAAFLF